MKTGFVGIGVMGESMARHLMNKGHELTVYNRTRSKEVFLKISKKSPKTGNQKARSCVI